jgi:hypothetical protein
MIGDYGNAKCATCSADVSVKRMRIAVLMFRNGESGEGKY